MKPGGAANLRDAPSSVGFADTFSPSRGRRLGSVILTPGVETAMSPEDELLALLHAAFLGPTEPEGLATAGFMTRAKYREIRADELTALLQALRKTPPIDAERSGIRIAQFLYIATRILMAWAKVYAADLERAQLLDECFTEMERVMRSRDILNLSSPRY